jgi:hypothetical protein
LSPRTMLQVAGDGEAIAEVILVASERDERHTFE